VTFQFDPMKILARAYDNRYRLRRRHSKSRFSRAVKSILTKINIEFSGKRFSEKDVEILRDTVLFDSRYYANKHGVDEVNAAKHYLLHGWHSKNEPSPFFDQGYYLDRYPDVLAAETNPLLHYLRYGGVELRSPSPDFDPQIFLDHHPYHSSDTITPAEICIKNYGSFQWRPNFDPSSNVSDEAARHFMQHFDERFYKYFYKDIDAHCTDAYGHFLRHGQFDYRNPCQSFDSYLVAKQLGIVKHPGKNIVMEVYKNQELMRDIEITKSVSLDHFSDTGSGHYKSVCSLCIHVHCFYIEIFEKMVPHLLHLKTVKHLVVTVTTLAHKVAVEKLFSCHTRCFQLSVLLVENRGKDIAPFLLASSIVWKQYDIVLHLHTKLSSHVTWGREWGEYLVSQTIGSPNLVKKMQCIFSRSESLGCAYPENFFRIKPYLDVARYDRNMSYYGSLLAIDPESATNEFAAGSMSWYRTAALAKVLNVVSSIDLFEEENNQREHTLAHSLERLIPMSVTAAGYDTMIYTSIVQEPDCEIMPCSVEQ